MNIAIIIANVLAMLALGVSVWFYARVMIPKWAENNFLFCSPKIGRIKAIRRSGRIIRFIGNLVGTSKIVTNNGSIVDGTEKTPGFWMKRFGADFIWLDDVYTYKIATEVTEKKDGGLEYVEDTASSIYLNGTYPIQIFLYTKEGILFQVKLQLKTTTLNAAKALSLPVSWTKPLFAAVIAASRDYFGCHEATDLISAQNEGKAKISDKEIANSGFVKLIKGLNETDDGNISLAEVCGQYIDAVNVVDVDFATEEDKLMYFKPYVSEQAKTAKIRDAEAEAESLKIKSRSEKDAAKNKAVAIRVVGEATADSYKNQHIALGGDSVATASVLVAEKHSTMNGLTTLVVNQAGHEKSTVLAISPTGGNSK